MENLAKALTCNHCGRKFTPTKGNHRGMCSTLCRFMEKVTFSEDGCWTWNGALNGDGYGLFNDRTLKINKAHRWAYARIGLLRPLVDGLTIDHLCRNRGCVNPDHMEQVTHEENMHRSAGHRNETHCRKGGHEFTPENTGWQAGGTKRYCRQCTRERQAPWAREYRASLKREQTNA